MQRRRVVAPLMAAVADRMAAVDRVVVDRMAAANTISR
jgi:hypothetical protein